MIKSRKTGQLSINRVSHSCSAMDEEMDFLHSLGVFIDNSTTSKC